MSDLNLDWPDPIKARLKELGQNPWGYQRYLPSTNVSQELADRRQRYELGWTGAGWDTPPISRDALQAVQTDWAIEKQLDSVDFHERGLARVEAASMEATKKLESVGFLGRALGRATAEKLDVVKARQEVEVYQSGLDAAREDLRSLLDQRSDMPVAVREKWLYAGYRDGATESAVSSDARTMAEALRDSLRLDDKRLIEAGGELPPSYGTEAHERRIKRMSILHEVEDRQRNTAVLDHNPGRAGQIKELHEAHSVRVAAEAIRPTVEHAKTLQAELFRLYTMDNTPLGVYQEGQSMDKYAQVDPGVINEAERSLREFVTAHPEIHHVNGFDTWVQEADPAEDSARSTVSETRPRDRVDQRTGPGTTPVPDPWDFSQKELDNRVATWRESRRDAAAEQGVDSTDQQPEQLREGTHRALGHGQ